MDRKDLLKQLLPGLLPLIIFIIADEIWSTETSLLIAIGFGIAEFAFTYFKAKRIEKFILLDTGLLVLMGGVSILADNDIFFKLKPALIELILVVILGISAFSSRNILLMMSSRYLKNTKLDQQQESYIARSARIMFFLFLFHTILIVYSAWFMSKEAWAFISGALFYILFGVFIAFEWIKNRWFRKSFKQEEWLPLVDEEGKIIGKAPRTEVHKNKNLMHPVVHLHVLNEKLEIFLQKRPEDKLVQPGKWDTAVGGHIEFNESVEKALIRETREEIGLIDFSPILVRKYKWESEIETELVFMFMTFTKNQIQVNNQEVVDGKFWPLSELNKNIGKEIFTPNFEFELRILEDFIKKGMKKV